jgi:YD repeat-containing protein
VACKLFERAAPVLAGTASGGETQFGFAHDALGRQIRRSGGRAFTLEQRFDAAGQLTGQSSGQVKRAYEYDRAFAPVRIDDSLWGETKLAYDGNGQLASADGASGTERFAYDAARNVAGAASGLAGGYGGAAYRASALDGWQSSPGGVVKIARGPKGERIRLLHDDCGRLIERQVERDGFRAQVRRYSWDAQDRLSGCVTPEFERYKTQLEDDYLPHSRPCPGPATHLKQRGA